MDKQIIFYKMVASGNDFVVVDNRHRQISEPVRFTRRVCDRHQGIGADGVLLVEKGDRSPAPLHRDLPPFSSKKADFRVRIFNADGSEAEACGNGFRCVALLAHEKFGLPKKQRFESLSGWIEAEVKEGRVRVNLPPPSRPSGPEKIKVLGREIHYYFMSMSNPHVVIFVEGIARSPVAEIGREIRFHRRFKPAGTNVNFVEVRGPQAITVRTYERGVEEETRACGTGSAASAVVAAHLGYTEPPVEVKTSGGEVLTVDFVKKGDPVRKLYLEGEARLVFEGKWSGNEQ